MPPPVSSCFTAAGLVALRSESSLQNMSYRLFRAQNDRSPSQTDYDTPSPNSVPNSQISEAPAYISVEELISQNQDKRKHLRMLHRNLEGGATWFRLRNKITKSILTMLKAHLPFAYPTYNQFPIELKERWFRAFVQEYNWDVNLCHITHEVRTKFHETASETYSNNLAVWKRSWVKNSPEPPYGCNANRYTEFCKYWSLDSTKKVSAIKSKNRRSERNGKGIATHNSGAMTYETREFLMTQERGGEPPDYLMLIEATHTSKKNNKIGDQKALEVIENVKRRKLDLLSQEGTQELTRDQMNRLVLEETPQTKGRVYGLGKLVQANSSSTVFHKESSLAQAERRA